MHANLVTLTLLSGALLLTGCESMSLGQRTTTAPPPSEYETVTTPILENAAPAGTLAPPANPTPPARPVRSRVVDHTVAPGESLWSLSRRYETTIQEIREANQISGDTIRAGQLLKIPTSLPEGDPFTPAPALAAPASPSQPPSTPAGDGQPLPPPAPGPVKTPSAPSWTVTPPITPPTSSPAPQYRIPEPVILPPPGDN